MPKDAQPSDLSGVEITAGQNKSAPSGFSSDVVLNFVGRFPDHFSAGLDGASGPSTVSQVLTGKMARAMRCFSHH